MKKNNQLKKIVLGTILIASSAGIAQAGQWAVGLNVGSASTDALESPCNTVDRLLTLGNSSIANSDTFLCDIDDSDTGLSANVSYNFNDIWGAEVGYMDLGSYSSSVRINGVGSFTDGTTSVKVVDLDLDALYAAVTATVKFATKWSVTGRLGYSRLSASAENDAGSASDDESIAVVGISGSYMISPKWSANLRYDYFDTEASLDMISAGVKYHF